MHHSLMKTSSSEMTTVTIFFNVLKFKLKNKNKKTAHLSQSATDNDY